MTPERPAETLADCGRRVVVTGTAGAGKSTFSRALSARTGLPVIVLDLHFWQPGWVEPSEDQWRETQRALLAGDEWIADGNYHETLELRLERAETVVYLDTPWWLCATRALIRGVRNRPAGFELPEGCAESRGLRWRAEWRLAGLILRNHRADRARELAIVSEHGRHTTLHMLRSKQAVRAFLEGRSKLA